MDNRMKSHKVVSKTINGIQNCGFFPSLEGAQGYLLDKAAEIRARSEGKNYSYMVSDQDLNSVTIGVIAGNPEAIRMEVI